MVIDNIHSIIAAAGVKFNETQLEHLFVLIQDVRNPFEYFERFFFLFACIHNMESETCKERSVLCTCYIF